MIMELYKKIDKSKIQFDFIIDRENELFFCDEIKLNGGRIFYLKNINQVSIFEFKKQWDNFFKEHIEYKIIHCHVRSVASIVLNIAKQNGLTTICHSHSTSNGKGIKAIVKKVLQKNIIKYADFLFSCSRESAIWLYGGKNANSDKCYIINNSIDTSKYEFNSSVRDKIRNELEISNKIVIGQVGRIEKMKNHYYSLRVLKECLKYDERFILLIVGDGSLKQDVEQSIIDLNLKNNVIMIGNRKDVNELMQAMDIFVMPSLFEGLPLALVEAQASGLPCIVSNNISAGFLIPDLIHKLDLEEEYCNWAKVIRSSINSIRINSTQKIIEAGFDVVSNANWLENFYLNLK